jgi:hypothetical protein
MPQAGRSWVRLPMRWMNFFQFIWSFQAHYCPGVDSASNRNDHQEYSGGVKRNWCIRLTTSQPSVSQLSRKCRVLAISQPHRPVKGIALLFVYYEASGKECIRVGAKVWIYLHSQYYLLMFVWYVIYVFFLSHHLYKALRWNILHYNRLITYCQI